MSTHRPTKRHTARTPEARLLRRGRVRAAQLLGITGAAAIALVAFRYQAPLVAQNADPVFTRDVAPILFKNCTTCHRPGGLGPFSLMSYDSAKANVEEIEDAVKTGYMPPWHAEGPRGMFLNDRRLADAEKQMILRWIQTGAAEGDAKSLPPAPVYTTDWEMGQPDAVVSMAEDFTVPASGTVEYQYFEVPTNFTADQWIQAIEFKPGAREVVHHVLVYARPPAAPRTATPASAATPAPAATPGAAAPKQRPIFLDQDVYETPPEPARIDTRHPAPRRMGTLIGGTAPGTNVMKFPEGTALRIRAGTVLTFQMHYTAKGHAMHDRTSVGFKFANGAPEEELRMAAFINGKLVLPAGAKNVQVASQLEPTETVKIWGLLPHTHLRGTGWKYTVERANGTTEVVLDVPRYDFNWQTYYFFATPLELRDGDKLKSVAWYDNSATNSSNPDATKDVHWGDQTWEEMQYTGFLYSINSRRMKPATK